MEHRYTTNCIAKARALSQKSELFLVYKEQRTSQGCHGLLTLEMHLVTVALLVKSVFDPSVAFRFL